MSGLVMSRFFYCYPTNGLLHIFMPPISKWSITTSERIWKQFKISMLFIYPLEEPVYLLIILNIFTWYDTYGLVISCFCILSPPKGYYTFLCHPFANVQKNQWENMTALWPTIYNHCLEHLYMTWYKLGVPRLRLVIWPTSLFTFLCTRLQMINNKLW